MASFSLFSVFLLITHPQIIHAMTKSTAKNASPNVPPTMGGIGTRTVEPFEIDADELGLALGDTVVVITNTVSISLQKWCQT